MIELEDIVKYYPGQATPAIDNLTLSIPNGEICTLVGPSGCGKSTLLRMINRMIEPTSGSIKIDGKDIREANPDRLRMGIGYVIQQIGLLPHRTIAENIALVPKLYAWPKEKIDQRVDELLVTMGLNPQETRHKYPSQLSGGQMQRVGVARAMAVDPPIMLMDEPFGAVDPIARSHLQDEFLRLQKSIKKTIVFVTHDINEAIKMGDKIAIFNRGQLVQFGTPEEILTRPANEFVESFIGYDRVVKKLNLYCVEDVAKPVSCTLGESELAQAAAKLKETESQVAFLLDDAGRKYGFITLEEATSESIPAELKQAALKRQKAFVQAQTPLSDALSVILEFDCDYLGVLKGDELLGVVSFRDIRHHVHRKEVY